MSPTKMTMTMTMTTMTTMTTLCHRRGCGAARDH
jgi:hypothetical protein